MARRIVFLDIDGVLNTSWSRQANAAERGFDRAAVVRLNRLVARTGAEVVLSSAWRTFVETEDMQAMLEAVGFAGRLVGRTPRRWELDPEVHRRLAGTDPPPEGSWPRGYEIQQWLDLHDDVGAIVILDDRDDMHHLSAWLVRTSLREGLLDIHVEAAVRRLAVPGPPRMATPVDRSPVRPRAAVQRVVFLDVDGVLRSGRSAAQAPARWRDLDPHVVARLNEVIERTQAVVVLSSAWRAAIGTEEVQARLDESGFRGTVIDRTPSRDEHDPAVRERPHGTTALRPETSWPRSWEIQQWLDAHPEVKGVVILDAHEDMRHLQPWLVTTSRDGLQAAQIDDAVARLLAPPPPLLRTASPW